MVNERLALDLSRRTDAWLGDLLKDLVDRHGPRQEDNFLDSLDKDDLASPAWASLIDRLTIAETYFFRDSGQMDLLRYQLLPQLMVEATGRRLRVWSAGCSTGEELYSIAMLLDGLGALPADLLGTDVNPQVVDLANQGVYRERSLRSLPVALKSAYLDQVGVTFRVLDRLRESVRFRVENLVAAQQTLVGVDLIVCRNVLIYIDRQRLPEILHRFFQALRPGGLLLTGHGELLTLETPFEKLAFPTSVVYRRPDSRGRKPQTGSKNGAESFDSNRRRFARPVSDLPVKLDPAQLCRQARKARLKGQPLAAGRLLRQALYLDPEAALGFLELGLLVASKDRQKAEKHRQTALVLLGAELPSHEVALALEELERVLR